MAILIIITLAIYRTTSQTFKYRDVVQVEGDFYNNIRLAMAILERDISATFNPVTLNPTVTKNPYLAAQRVQSMGYIPPTPASGQNPGDAAKLDKLSNSELGQITEYWLGAFDITAIRGSRFNGKDEKMSFVSASHQRLYKNTPESEFVKIRYELHDDPDENAIQGTKVLAKVEDTNVFDDVDLKNKNEHTYPLLSGVKKFRCRYYRQEKKEWLPAWDNSKDDIKGTYPDFVEITLIVDGPKRLHFEGTYIFKPENTFYGLEASF